MPLKNQIRGIFYAESGGFEPPVQYNPYDSLANCWFQPLTQLSNPIWLVQKLLPDAKVMQI